MQVPINIALPVLVAGQYFKVEYSTDNINWTFDGYHGSNQILTNYNGFTTGVQYYFRISLVLSLSPLEECDPIIIPFFVPEDITCYTFETSLIKLIAMWMIEVNYTVPSPAVTPCSWEVRYGGSFPLANSVIYNTLPNPSFYIPTVSGNNYIEVYALDCEGNRKLCYTSQAIYVIPPCVPAVISGLSITSVSGNHLNISITHSSPIPASYTIAYSQCQTPHYGIADPGGVVTVNAFSTVNPQTIVIPINPNIAVSGENPVYCGTITDGCGNTIPFSVSKY